MSQPDERVYVSEGKGKNFTYATASCQGWRREQEDAEECLPYFDDDASLFVLCDGHGGAEVAKYTVKHLPDFIKNHPKYKEGAIKEALKQAFIEFDALLRTDKVMAELHKLAFEDTETNNKESPKQPLDHDGEEGNKKSNNENDNPPNPTVESSAGHSSSAVGTSSSSNNGSSTIVEDVDIGTLRREAKVSLSELLGEYSSVISSESHGGRSHLFSKAFPSPVIRKKEDPEDANADNGGACTSTSSDLQEKRPQPSSSKSEDEEPPQGPSTSHPEAQLTRKDLMKQVLDRYFQGVEDSSDDSEYEEDSNDEDDDGDDEGDDDAGCVTNKKLRRKKHKRPVSERIDSSTDDDDEDDDDYGADDQDDDDDDGDDDEDDDSEQDADQEEDDDDDDDDDDDEDEDVEDEDEEGAEIDEENWKTMQDMITPGARTHKPGLDSGCTVVVALIKNSKLYVASAGDSRCIIIKRNGECVPMSYDHKPEDIWERRRIQSAGGRVMDGRVNGGLNLSRAFGDFTYKQSTLVAQNQMITPLPDVRLATLDPKKIEYIFLACDGIWNSMKNQEVTDFIQKIAQTSENNLVDICIQLFRNCIAPKTDGDGTGCDNMTCILARYNEPKEEEEEEGDSAASSDLKNSEVKEQPNEPTTTPASSSSQKRSYSEESSTDDVLSIKRRCLRL